MLKLSFMTMAHYSYTEINYCALKHSSYAETDVLDHDTCTLLMLKHKLKLTVLTMTHSDYDETDVFDL
jgi:hypothetical protein